MPLKIDVGGVNIIMSQPLVLLSHTYLSNNSYRNRTKITMREFRYTYPIFSLCL